MDAVCSHEGGPLEEGTLEDYTLICPWHQGKFDIRTAKVFAETDWVTNLKSYPVTVDEDIKYQLFSINLSKVAQGIVVATLASSILLILDEL